MSEEKDNLKSIKVYKFNNTKENWHEFALKFRGIADTRGYWEIIKGTMIPPDEQVTITVTTEDRGEVLKEKKEKLKARAANKMGYRDLLMSTEGISLNIVENAVSEELTKGDLRDGGIRKQEKIKLRNTLLPLVRNNSYTSFDIKNFPRRIRKPEKSTQALSVYRKGTFRVYIKCLIVASSKVTIKRRGRKKRSLFVVPV